MIRNLLEGAFQRLARAGEHLADLQSRLAVLQKQQESATSAQFSAEPPYHFEFIVPVSVPASMRIPILIGEICYNLRSALDYLVYELAKHDSGAQSDTQFPNLR
jgi:hypothetical protein